MSDARSPSGLVTRAAKTIPGGARGHRSPLKANDPKRKPVATGGLAIHLVVASIDEKHPQGAPGPDAGRVFDVKIRRDPGTKAKARLLVRTTSPILLPKMPPGTYRIDVAEHVSKGVFQKYPAAACLAVVGAGKTTTAYAVLANDTLRAVAHRIDVRIGAELDFGDPVQMLTLRHEFNLASVCLPPGSIQGSKPLAQWFSAEQATRLAEPALDAWLTANGWAVPRFGPIFTSLLGPGFEDMQILPTPVTWMNTNQTGAWMATLPPGAPPAHELIADHARTLVRWLKKLVGQVVGPAKVGKILTQWVGVNELEDTADTAYWGGVPKSKKESLTERLGITARRYLEVMHEEDPHALTLMNDFDHEFYPPSRQGAKGKLARQIKTLAKHSERARRFHGAMAVVQKSGALHGKIGAGYQMHFQRTGDYHDNPALYRNALKDGIARLRRMGARRVSITEMALSVRYLHSTKVAAEFSKPPKAASPPTAADKVASDAWATHRQTLFEKYGYAKTAGTAIWQKQAEVFRDIVTTYLLEDECKTVTFWGMVDQPDDPQYDVYGHLFDSVAGTPGVYPEGPGCMRKPAYYGVLNGLIDAAHVKKPDAVRNWMRRWRPPT